MRREEQVRWPRALAQWPATRTDTHPPPCSLLNPNSIVTSTRRPYYDQHDEDHPPEFDM